MYLQEVGFIWEQVGYLYILRRSLIYIKEVFLSVLARHTFGQN